jgi:hypothetical protein
VSSAPRGADDTYALEQEAVREPIAPGGPRVEYALDIVEVMVSGDMAVVRDEWTEIVTPPPPAAVSKTKFRSFEIWRRQPDASWKIARWIDGPPQPVAAAQ